MIFARTSAVLAKTVAISQRATAVRTFSVSAAPRDTIQDIYVKAIKSFVPDKSDATAAPATKITVPTGSDAPAFETIPESLVATFTEKVSEADAWAKVQDPIDDPENYDRADNYKI